MDVSYDEHHQGGLLAGAQSLAAGELEHFKSLLSLAAGAALPLCPSKSVSSRDLIRHICLLLSGLQKGRILWKGRPEVLRRNVLRRLQTEAAQVRCEATRNGGCWLAKVGPCAQAVLESADFDRFVNDIAGPHRLMIKTYTFYLEPGDHLSYHLDNLSSDFSAVLMLRHLRPADGPSSRLLFLDSEGIEQEIPLNEGEAVFFQGSSILHGREPVSSGEAIDILALSFGVLNR